MSPADSQVFCHTALTICHFHSTHLEFVAFPLLLEDTFKHPADVVMQASEVRLLPSCRNLTTKNAEPG